MKLIRTADDQIDIRLTMNNLSVLNNALNEVCNGIDSFEFRARLGITREEATALLTQVQEVLRAAEGKKI